jgi:putative tryptophan/tyrosine transport system substrate-binding protein
MRRREFISLLGGAAAAWPLAARAQQSAAPVIAFLRRTDPIRVDFASFTDGLKALGYEDGRTIRIEQRYANGNLDRLRAQANELAGMNLKLFVVDGTVTAEAVMSATRQIPIITVLVSDPARLGIMNINRPGGNVTGLSAMVDDLYAKRLELLKEIVPNARRVAVLRNPLNASPIATRVISETASKLGLSLRTFDASEVAAWPAIIAAIANDRADALLQQADATFASQPKELMALTLVQRLRGIYPEREFVDAGGLISYGIGFADQWRRAAQYVDKILQGTPAGELPIEQPTRFQLVLNLNTARTLGLDVPPTLLARADEVIE